MLRTVFSCLAVLLVVGCGGSPYGSAPASPASSPSTTASTQPAARANTPELAVKALLPVDPGQSSNACWPAQGNPFTSPSCPITDRLRQRLTTVNQNADPVCRCQNVAPTTVQPASISGSTARVRVTFNFPSSPYDMTFTAVKQGGLWAVDDTSCGNPPRSVYDDPLGPCT
jgi:hypothetical protein